MSLAHRRYDEHGFPIPPSFEDREKEARQSRPATPGRGKRIVLWGMLIAVAVGVAMPYVRPTVAGMMAEWKSRQAEQKLREGDLAGAVSDLTTALDWSPDNFRCRFFRAEARLQLKDLEGCLADLNWILTAGPRIQRLQQAALQRRAFVLVRLGRGREAIDDAHALVRFAPQDPTALNDRAYIRALANVSREELEAGLADIEAAIAQVGDDNAAFLDTRGYLLHLLGQHTKALEDLNRAIELTESGFEWGFARGIQRRSEDLAVMLHHRGQVYRALKQEAKAEEDLSRAEELGYDPSAGVF